MPTSVLATDLVIEKTSRGTSRSILPVPVPGELAVLDDGEAGGVEAPRLLRARLQRAAAQAQARRRTHRPAVDVRCPPGSAGAAVDAPPAASARASKGDPSAAGRGSLMGPDDTAGARS